MRRNLRDKIHLKLVPSLNHRHRVGPSHNAFSACVARWASYEVLHNRTVQQRRLEAFESYHHHILPIRLYVFQWSNWQKPEVKFPHRPILLWNKSVFPMAIYSFGHCFLYPRSECIMKYGAVRKFYPQSEKTIWRLEIILRTIVIKKRARNVPQ